MLTNIYSIYSQQLNNMVHEVNPNASDREEGIVNSTSLEDVALSEVCIFIFIINTPSS